ncbi:MAG TPA: hypothetical protein VF618_12300 [Thermoanaerobaculia bacterium]
MKRSTKPDDIRPPLDELQRAAREAGEALSRARGRDPQSFFHGLPSWYSMLPLAFAALFARDEALWSQIAAHHGMTIDEWRDSFLDLFEPMSTLTRCFRCTGCGATDRTVWNKKGVQHWRRGGDGEVFEVICGEWELCPPGADG